MNQEELVQKHDVKTYVNSSFSKNLEKENFSHSQFTDFSIHNKEIKNCNFSFCFFQRVYFRKAVFTECDFTGAKFFDSNLRDAEFIRCKFPYSVWKFTIIRDKQVLNNLPEWPNVKIHLLQNHKANANSLGDTKAVRSYLLEEMDAHKEHFRRARSRKEGYYSQKYNSVADRIYVWWKSATLYFDDKIWGHGEAPHKIVWNVAILLLIFALIQTLNQDLSKAPISQIGRNLLTYYIIDFKVFIGIPGLEISDLVKCILILLRYITLSLFVRILFNKFSWR